MTPLAHNYSKNKVARQATKSAAKCCLLFLLLNFKIQKYHCPNTILIANL